MRHAAFLVCRALVGAAALATTAQAGQDGPRVFSTRDIAPPSCSCASTAADAWWPGLAAGPFWGAPRLGVQVDPGVWLGFNLPVPMADGGWQSPAATTTRPMPGGIMIEVSPAEAELWVDGALAGPAMAFSPAGRPLPLSPGTHRVELRAEHHVTLLFDVLITPGYVLPWRGFLRPAR